MHRTCSISTSSSKVILRMWISNIWYNIIWSVNARQTIANRSHRKAELTHFTVNVLYFLLYAQNILNGIWVRGLLGLMHLGVKTGPLWPILWYEVKRSPVLLPKFHMATILSYLWNILLKWKSLVRKYMDDTKIQDRHIRIYSTNFKLNTTILKILPTTEMYVFTIMLKMKQEVTHLCW